MTITSSMVHGMKVKEVMVLQGLKFCSCKFSFFSKTAPKDKKKRRIKPMEHQHQNYPGFTNLPAKVWDEDIQFFTWVGFNCIWAKQGSISSIYLIARVTFISFWPNIEFPFSIPGNKPTKFTVSVGTIVYFNDSLIALVFL